MWRYINLRISVLISVFFLLQLIFRKIADVIKERELAERTKDNPPMDLAMNHPVRKLISRFRKMSNMKINVPSNILEEGTKDGNTVLGGKVPSEDRRGSRDKPLLSSPMDFAPRNSSQSTIKSLWKLPPASGEQSVLGDNPYSPAPNSSDSRTKPSSSNQVQHINPMFRTAAESVKSGENEAEADAKNARHSSTLTSSSKISPGKKWGKLLGSSQDPSSDTEHSKALSALLKPASNNGDLALKNQSQTSASSLEEDFNKLSFYEMNCCLRNDMMTINNRMGGIDLRLTQILQMLRDTINSGRLPAYHGPATLPTGQFQTGTEKLAFVSSQSGDPTSIQASSSAITSETLRSSRPLTTSCSLREDQLPKGPSSDEQRGGIPAISSSTPLAISLSTTQTILPRQCRTISPQQSSFESTQDSARMLIPPEEAERSETTAYPINYLSKLKKRRESRASSDV